MVRGGRAAARGLDGTAVIGRDSRVPAGASGKCLRQQMNSMPGIQDAIAPWPRQAAAWRPLSASASAAVGQTPTLTVPHASHRQVRRPWVTDGEYQL